VPALLVVLPENRSLSPVRPAFSGVNHGISARFDRKTTPCPREFEKELSILPFVINALS
jgi:hypothetical protein